MSIQLAESALHENKSVHIIYSGGSFPGKLREVIPKQISENSLLAFCKLRNDVREFVLDKVTFIPASEKDNYPTAVLPIFISDWQALYFLITPYLKVGFLLSLSHHHLKLSRKGKTLIELEYVDKDKAGFKRERPYIVAMTGAKRNSFKEFNSAANVFLNEFNFAYKGEKSLNYELSYLSEMKKNWKPRAKAKLELICELTTKDNDYFIKTDHWAYLISYGHREALGISFEERYKDKKKYHAWVQSNILSFKVGDLYESNCGQFMIQVTYAVPMGWDMEKEQMYEGIVTFDQFIKTQKDGYKKSSSYSCKQTEFLSILITGENLLSPLIK